jgi:uncharacterized membrane protein YraQ (UPF0718 family)
MPIDTLTTDEQILGLVTHAQEQQVAIDAALNGLNAARESLAKERAELKTLGQSIHQYVKTAIEKAVQSETESVTKPAKEKMTPQLLDFSRAITSYRDEVGRATREVSQTVRNTSWWIFGGIFVAGVAVGSIGLYFLHTPKGSEVNIDPMRIEAWRKATCKGK